MTASTAVERRDDLLPRNTLKTLQLFTAAHEVHTLPAHSHLAIELHVTSGVLRTVALVGSAGHSLQFIAKNSCKKPIDDQSAR